MDNPFVGFETFTKQRTDDDEHPYGEDSHLDEDSILERTGDVETGDNYYEPDDYEANQTSSYQETDDPTLEWGGTPKDKLLRLQDKGDWSPKKYDFDYSESTDDFVKALDSFINSYEEKKKDF